MVTAQRVRRLIGCIACAVLLGASSLNAQYGAKANGEWPTYGGDLGNTKYSPLDQITKDNFDELEIAWRWQSADGFSQRDRPGWR